MSCIRGGAPLTSVVEHAVAGNALIIVMAAALLLAVGVLLSGLGRFIYVLDEKHPDDFTMQFLADVKGVQVRGAHY
jgi:hypothetical protein